jgi:hypothetical protein
MAKTRFNFKKMSGDEGQEIPITDTWSVWIWVTIEPHDYGDTEPYMVPAISAVIRQGDKTRATMHIDEGIIFPKGIVLAIREPLLRILNEAQDFVEDYDLGSIYEKMKKAGTWPPPKEIWILKEESC